VVVDSVLGHGATVAAGAELCNGSVIGDGEDIAEGVCLDGVKQPPPA